jgi:glycosyltransferase involved in cell wall biosynthesis
MPPAPGGGGVYTTLLSHGLAVSGAAGSVLILTEAFPAEPARTARCRGAVEIRRIYPYRAGVSRKNLASYAKYALQNLQFLGLPRLVERERIDVVLFHSSFFNHPGTPAAVVRCARGLSRARWVADVRDPLLPRGTFSALYPFDAVIACSENVLAHISSDPQLAPKVHLVPIPVSTDGILNVSRTAVLARFGLRGRSFVFSSSGIVAKKGIEDAIEAVRIARQTDPELSLVVIGKSRDWQTRHDLAEREGLLRYLGIVDHQTALALAAEAIVDLNLSSVDSMPRGSLESLMVGTPILVPRGIPEFEACCSECVVTPGDHVTVARRILEFQKSRTLPLYDTAMHSVEHVVRETAQVFASVWQDNNLGGGRHAGRVVLEVSGGDSEK